MRRSGDTIDDAERPDDPADASNERVLIGRLRQSDTSAYQVLFTTHVDRLIEFAYGYTRSRETSRDIVQDVLWMMWEQREQLEIRESLRAYLLRAVRNRALDVLRHERVAEKYEARVSADAEHDYPAAYNLGPSSIESQEFLEAVRDAVQRLSPRLREVFLLHREQGLTYQEIASAMGITVASVTVQMSRAVKALHEMLEEWEF